MPIKPDRPSPVPQLPGGSSATEKAGLPWADSPQGSYVYYECTVGVMLDSGIVVHNRLPQVNNTPDTLASVGLDDANLDAIIDKGVNISSNDQYQDIVQRMGHSRYWFRLWGVALRIGFQVPIPSIKTIGGVPAIPYDKNPQWAQNGIMRTGNYGGVILWRAYWSLWYTTDRPPTSQQIPFGNPAAHITPDKALKPGQNIQAPFSNSNTTIEQGGPVRV